MLDLQIYNKIDSWAIRWCYSQYKLNKYTIYPVVSRVKSIGLDGTETHSGVNDKYKVVLQDSYVDCNFENVEFDKKILFEFKKYFLSYYDYVINIPRDILNRLKKRK